MDLDWLRARLAEGGPVHLEPWLQRMHDLCATFEVGRGGDLVDLFLYDHEFIREPDSVKVAHTVTVVTNLYDVASRDRVWTIQSTCFDKASMEDVLLDEAIAIVRQLQIDELI